MKNPERAFGVIDERDGHIVDGPMSLADAKHVAGQIFKNCGGTSPRVVRLYTTNGKRVAKRAAAIAAYLGEEAQ